MKSWMIYGANGYTGRIIINVARELGMSPILAGRNREQVVELASQHNLEYRLFDLSSEETVCQNLSDVNILLNCAGPFSATAEVMISCCLQTTTHYLDITGEIDVFEHARSFDKKAKHSNVVICPGVGFDVVPTDCLSSLLKNELPSAIELALAFQAVASKLSPGTAKTAVEGAAKGGRVRKNGELLSVPQAYAYRDIDFGKGLKSAVSIAWGDVSTAYYTTGIPNIMVFLPMSVRGIKQLKKRRKYMRFLRSSFMQNFLKRRIEKNIKGQPDEERKNSKMIIWGEVVNDEGECVTGRFETGNGYDVTAVGAVEAVDFLLNNDTAGGFYTPSMLMGPEVLKKLPGYTGVVFEHKRKKDHHENP